MAGREARVLTDVPDPVCGLPIPIEQAEALGAFKVVHEGKTHWLCSSTCRDAFVKHPERYERAE